MQAIRAIDAQLTGICRHKVGVSQDFADTSKTNPLHQCVIDHKHSYYNIGFVVLRVVQIFRWYVVHVIRPNDPVRSATWYHQVGSILHFAQMSQIGNAIHALLVP